MDSRNDVADGSRACGCCAAIVIGNTAGHYFAGQADLRVAYHATRTHSDGRVDRGLFVKRKWMADRSAFAYDPSLGWAKEHWFEWPDA